MGGKRTEINKSAGEASRHIKKQQRVAYESVQSRKKMLETDWDERIARRTGEQKQTTNANDKHTNEEFVQSENIFNIFAVICRILDAVRGVH